MDFDNIERVSVVEDVDDEIPGGNNPPNFHHRQMNHDHGHSHNHAPSKPGNVVVAAASMVGMNMVAPATSVLELLEYPVCTNYMYPPIHQYHNGHTLCSTWVHNWCPSCRQELGDIRCLALEKVAESLVLLCKYYSLWCPEIFPYYIVNSSTKDRATSDFPFLVSHLRDGHKVDMHIGCTFNHRYVKSNPRKVENATWMLTVFHCFGQYLCLHFEPFQLGMAQVYMACLRLMGDDIEARNYSYSMEVGANGRKLIREGTPRSVRDSPLKVRDSHDGLIIQRNMALFFSEVTGRCSSCELLVGYGKSSRTMMPEQASQTYVAEIPDALFASESEGTESRFLQGEGILVTVNFPSLPILASASVEFCLPRHKMQESKMKNRPNHSMRKKIICFFTGCFASKRFKQVPGYEDPVELAAETPFTVSEVQSLYELFKKLSSSIIDDGLIHKEEFNLALFRNQNKRNLFADRIFDVFDLKRNGMIEFGEFVRSLGVFHPNAPTEEKIAFAFRLYDLRQTGFIEREELKEMVLALLHESELVLLDDDIETIVNKTFSDTDTKGDGKIDQEEWREFVSKNPSLIKNMTLPYLKGIRPVFSSFMMSPEAENQEM